MIVQEATYSLTHLALQRALYKAAFMRDQVSPRSMRVGETIIRQRSRFDAAIDRARARCDVPETLGMLLAIADLTAVAHSAGWEL